MTAGRCERRGDTEGALPPESDSFQNAPGWALDNIRLAAGGDACIAQQITDRIFADGFDP